MGVSQAFDFPKSPKIKSRFPKFELHLREEGVYFHAMGNWKSDILVDHRVWQIAKIPIPKNPQILGQFREIRIGFWGINNRGCILLFFKERAFMVLMFGLFLILLGYGAGLALLQVPGFRITMDQEVLHGLMSLVLLMGIPWKSIHLHRSG